MKLCYEPFKASFIAEDARQIKNLPAEASGLQRVVEPSLFEVCFCISTGKMQVPSEAKAVDFYQVWFRCVARKA